MNGDHQVFFFFLGADHHQGRDGEKANFAVDS